jgi:hypothetical protein
MTARLCLLAVALASALGRPDLPRPGGSSAGGRAHLTVFVMSDCPLSNYYAPEIQRLCERNRARGLTCALAYEDAALTDEQMRRHLADYGYRGMSAVVDRDRAIARGAQASVTPQAVLRGADGGVMYRGRIDNRYETFGKPRRVVTQHDLRDAIDAVLQDRPVRQPETPALGCFIPYGQGRGKRS